LRVTSDLRARTTSAPARRFRTVAAGVAALGLLGGLAACSGSSAAPVASEVSATPSPTPTPEPTSFFTGLPDVGGPVLAVKLDNTNSALPHLGLNAADVVYVEQVEGGLTRLAVIFSSKLPKVIAPIRSARETDAELLPMYGRIPVAFSGAVESVHQDVVAAGLIDVSADLGITGYTRMAGRYAPYDLAGDGPALLGRSSKKVEPKDVGFTFGELPAGGRPVKSVTANFPAAKIGFTYDADDDRWIYRLNGSLDQEPGKKPAGASTVIIQYVPIGTAGRVGQGGTPIPFASSVGKGKALVLRNGQAFDATWSRKNEKAPTTWQIDGEDVPLQAGQPWVVLANKNSPATVVKAKRPAATATPSATPAG
jgi:hypothetical protein